MGRYWIFDEEKFLVRELEGEYIILDLDSGCYYTLDEVGGFVFGMMRNDSSLEKIEESIGENYDSANRDAVRRDLQDLVQQLMEKKIVSPVSPGRDGGPP